MTFSAYALWLSDLPAIRLCAPSGALLGAHKGSPLCEVVVGIEPAMGIYDLVRIPQPPEPRNAATGGSYRGLALGERKLLLNRDYGTESAFNRWA